MIYIVNGQREIYAIVGEADNGRKNAKTIRVRADGKADVFAFFRLFNGDMPDVGRPDARAHQNAYFQLCKVQPREVFAAGFCRELRLRPVIHRKHILKGAQK